MDTEEILRSVIIRRSEIELIYLTTKNEKKKMNCIILMDALDKRQKDLENELGIKNDLEEKSWFSKIWGKLKNRNN